MRETNEAEITLVDTPAEAFKVFFKCYILFVLI
jgi:hypothetical protein